MPTWVFVAGSSGLLGRRGGASPSESARCPGPAAVVGGGRIDGVTTSSPGASSPFCPSGTVACARGTLQSPERTTSDEAIDHRCRRLIRCPRCIVPDSASQVELSTDRSLPHHHPA